MKCVQSNTIMPTHFGALTSSQWFRLISPNWVSFECTPTWAASNQNLKIPFPFIAATYPLDLTKTRLQIQGEADRVASLSIKPKNVSATFGMNEAGTGQQLPFGSLLIRFNTGECWQRQPALYAKKVHWSYGKEWHQLCIAISSTGLLVRNGYPATKYDEVSLVFVSVGFASLSMINFERN